MKIIEETPALADHQQQSTTGAVVLLVLLQVIRELVDPLGQQRDLHIRRAGISLVQSEVLDELRFLFRFHSVR